MTLFLLCWLFGVFGLHRFYTGKYLAGALQLLGVILGGFSALFKAEIHPAITMLRALGIILLVVWLVVDVARIIMGRYRDRDGLLIVQWV